MIDCRPYREKLIEMWYFSLIQKKVKPIKCISIRIEVNESTVATVLSFSLSFDGWALVLSERVTKMTHLMPWTSWRSKDKWLTVNIDWEFADYSHCSNWAMTSFAYNLSLYSIFFVDFVFIRHLQFRFGFGFGFDFTIEIGPFDSQAAMRKRMKAENRNNNDKRKKRACVWWHLKVTHKMSLNWTKK